MRACPRLLIAGALLLATLAANATPAAADIAPPWILGRPATALRAETVPAGSTLAITVQRAGANIQFSPAPIAAPAGCPTPVLGAPTYTCPATQVAAGLELVGDIVEVSVLGVATPTLLIQGGNDADLITVQGPSAAAESVGVLNIRTGAGADEVTIGGRVREIHDDPGVADASDDRYDITSTTIDVASTINPAGGDDVVNTADPELTVDGDDGNDTLSGPGVLKGGDGDDVLKPTSPTRQVDGGNGADRLSYEALSPFSPPSLVVELAGGGNVSVNDGVTTTTMLGIEQVAGGPGNDTLIGSADPDVLAGGDGNDRLQGRGGADTLEGGTGTDTVSYIDAGGGVAVDLAAGTGGTTDAIDTLSSFEAVLGSAGTDTVTGTAAAETFDVGAGDDTVAAGAGNDTVLGGPGNDQLRGGAGSDTLNGGDGADTALYDERSAGEPVNVSLSTVGDDGAAGENDTLVGIENAAGGAGNDVLGGDDGPNALSGNGGNDTISGLDGADVLHGGEGRDIVAGDLGSDMLFGDGGDDSLQAFDNIADALDCGDGADDDAQIDGLDRAENCEFRRRLDIPPVADADGDGVVEGTDCNDRNAAIRPGATDPPGDGIDQNCDGKDTALPVLSPDVDTRRGRVTRRGTPFAVTDVNDLPAGTQVTVTCQTTAQFPGRCPFRRKVVKLAAGKKKVTLTKLFPEQRDPRTKQPTGLPRVLPIGTRIELTISAPGYISGVVRFVVRRSSKPSEQRLCLPAGAKSPSACAADATG
jgi:Ca2+-binding RTX toxin-like protein